MTSVDLATILTIFFSTLNRATAVLAFIFAINVAQAQVPDRCQHLPEIGLPQPSSVCGASHPVIDQEFRELADGLSYRRFSCRVSYESMPSAQRRRPVCQRFTSTVHEVSIAPNRALQLFALHNPGAHVNPSCKNDYGGPIMSQVIARQNLYEVVAATNGNYFVPDGTQFRPRGFLWSNRILGALGLHGQRVFVVDRTGNHEISIEPVPCEQNAAEVCAVVTECDNQFLLSMGIYSLPSHAMGTAEFTRYIRRLFPSMTLAVQLNTSLLRSQWGAGGNLFEVDPRNPHGQLIPHYSRCTPQARRDPRQRWKCERTSRTALCGREDGGVSLLTMQSAYMYELALGLSPGGGCELNCRYLYALDGGGSSQLGIQVPSRNNVEASQFTMLFGRPTDQNTTSCGPYRAVDHLFVIGRYLR